MDSGQWTVLTWTTKHNTSTGLKKHDGCIVAMNIDKPVRKAFILAFYIYTTFLI